MQSALAMKVRAGALKSNGGRCSASPVRVDIAAGAIEVYDVTGDHFRIAEQLIGRHSDGRRLRTLDALQLAVALDLSQQGLVGYFVVADQVSVEIGATEGLKTINPQEP